MSALIILTSVILIRMIRNIREDVYSYARMRFTRRLKKRMMTHTVAWLEVSTQKYGY